MLSFLQRFPWFLSLLFFMDEQDDQVSSMLSCFLKVCFFFRSACLHRWSRGSGELNVIFSLKLFLFLHSCLPSAHSQIVRSYKILRLILYNLLRLDERSDENRRLRQTYTNLTIRFWKGLTVPWDLTIRFYEILLNGKLF